jgi:hypothetical protein
MKKHEIYDIKNVVARPSRTKSGNALNEMQFSVGNYGQGYSIPTRVLYIADVAIQLPA